jgi:hypothetical protein
MGIRNYFLASLAAIGLSGCVLPSESKPENFREETALTMILDEENYFIYYDPYVEHEGDFITSVGPVSSFNLDYRTRITYAGRINGQDEFILDPNTYKWGDERRLPLLPGQGEFVGLDHHIQLKESTLQTLKNPETGEEVSFRKVIVMVSEKEG